MGPSQNPCVEILAASVVGLGGGAFGKRLDHEDRAVVNGISALIRRDRKACLPTLFSLHHGKILQICWHLDVGLPSL